MIGTAPPKFLFRYRSADTPYILDELERAIGNREFYFSSAESLNDPFEISPSIVKPSEEEFLKIIREKYGKNPVISRNTIRKNSGEALSRQVHRRELKRLAPSLDTAKFMLKQMEETFSKLNAQTRIVCFNETPSSLPMWAHYANNHRGVCLSFELNITDHIAGEKAPLQVSYSGERPVLDIGAYESSNFGKQDSASDAAIDFARSVFLTKAKDWSYEKEWRAFDNSGTLPGYDRMSILKPDSIIFGINSENKFKEEVVEKFGDRVRLLEARLFDDKYDLAFHEIS